MRPGFSASTASQPWWVIEALRGLAATMVLWSHFRDVLGWSRALDSFFFTGVDLFFVLSGFVFGPSLWQGRLAWRPFLIRRAFRILPLFWASLFVYVGIKLWQQQPAWSQFHWHFFMLHTVYSPEIAAFYNIAYWSLPVEVEFYLVIPLCAALLAHPSRSAERWLTLFLVALSVHLALAWTTQPLSAPLALRLANVHLPGILIEFLLGSLVWRLGPLLASRRLHWPLVLAGLGLWLSIALFWTLIGDAGVNERRWLHGNLGLLAALAYALALLGLWSRHLGGAPATVAGTVSTGQWLGMWAGHLSYGVYLLHNAAYPLTQSFAGQPGSRLVLMLLFTFAGALLLHYSIEAPARRWGRRLAAGLDRQQP